MDGAREASLEDFQQVLHTGSRTYSPDGQKYLYSIDMSIIDNRYFWMSCDYDNAAQFRDYVINKETGEKGQTLDQRNKLNRDSNFLLVTIAIDTSCT